MKPVIDLKSMTPPRQATAALAMRGSGARRAMGLRRLRSCRASAIAGLWRGLFRHPAGHGDRALTADLQAMLDALAGPVGRRMGRREAGAHDRDQVLPRLPRRTGPWGRSDWQCGVAPAAARDRSGR